MSAQMSQADHEEEGALAEGIGHPETARPWEICVLRGWHQGWVKWTGKKLGAWKKAETGG